ncbi:PAS domain S-box-containing protein [Rhodospirillales bacterium URHD0017]|nr:PAS domain S-box-containing protein [Rhodospirillales bacterium URHD0017]
MNAPDRNGVSGVFDAVDLGLILLDGDRRVIGWNAWIENASGIADAAARGRRLDELFPGNVPPRLATAIAQALELGASSLVTHTLHPAMLRLRTPAGRELVHNISVRPIGKRPNLRCLLQVLDVTVVAGRERILRERQNARYDAVVSSAPDTILTLDADGTIQLVNPAAARQFGYSPDELVGQPLSSFLANPQEWSAAFKAARAGEGLGRPIEVTARRKNGSPSYLEASASRWTSEGRTFVTAILRDVNERRMAADALRLLNQTLEKRVAQSTADRNRMWTLSTDVMMVGGLDGTLNSVNPAWTHLLGWQASELIGANVMDFVVPEERAVLQDGLDALSRGTAPRLIELTMRTGNGASRRIEWSAVAADNLLQAVGRDVTAEREAEAALHHAEEALRHSQKMDAIGQLTGGIAHDFNNMLTAIIGSMEVLKRRIRDGRYDDVQSFMDGAIGAANRAAALTHRLLAFARRQPLDPKAVDVNQLINGMQDLLERTLGEKIKLVVQLEPGLGPALTDAHQLENAILNLAINARDAMPRGGTLTIATENVVIKSREQYGQETIDAGDYTVVCVGDTGVGMSPDTLSKVFEPFFTTKPLGQGTGLGLSMIYGFAKQSRGHIRVESAEDVGTTFRLYLPRYQGAVEARAIAPARDAATGAGETVLVIEDDSAVRLIISNVLRDLGYACLEASDGQAALPILMSNTPLDLLITDVGLPGMNGRQVAEVARQHRPELKILFVTGYAEHATGHAPFLARGMEMVTKPFALDALALKIRDMLRK